MIDSSRLTRNWVKWTNLARMNNVSISADRGSPQVGFISDDESFYLRRDGDSWAIDEIDDRGQRHAGLAKFSSLDLAEKYLIWRWSSVTRSAIGAKQLGVRLHALGMAPNVEISPTELEGAVELGTSNGSATVPRAIATIFSHLMSKSVDEVEQIVNEGIA